MWLTILGLLFITLIPATTAIVGRYPNEKLAITCFSVNSALQALVTSIFWSYVSKRQKDFATQSDSRLLAITSQIWISISVGWFVSILLGYINVFAAYISWVILPNLVAVWGGYMRRKLRAIVLSESSRHDKKKTGN